MTKQQFEKWLNDLIKPNLENLVGLSPTMGPLERYERSYIVTDNLTKEIMKKIQEIDVIVSFTLLRG